MTRRRPIRVTMTSARRDTGFDFYPQRSDCDSRLLLTAPRFSILRLSCSPSRIKIFWGLNTTQVAVRPETAKA